MKAFSERRLHGGAREPYFFGEGERALSISGGSIGTGGSERGPAQNEELEAPLIPHGRLIPFLVVTPLFFLWAIPNNLTDFLIRQFMK